MKHLFITGAVGGMKFLSMFAIIIAAVIGKWFIIPIAVCFSLGFIMWELHLDGVEGWWVKKELDYHRRN